MAEERKDLHKKELEDRIKGARSEDVVTIIYTSGSTGIPKGVMLTHANFISNGHSCAKIMKLDHRDRYLSFLPLSHVFERLGGYYVLLMYGAKIAYAAGRDTVLDDAAAVSPTIMYGVPRFFEKLYDQILNRAIGLPRVRRNLFFWGYRVGRACMFRRFKKKPIPLYLGIQKFLITRPISARLKRLFGGRLRFFISGGAPLPKEIAYFFHSFDILVLEGYGFTESPPVISVNTPEIFRMGTVGRPIPGFSVRIASNGEILASGPNIMKGYYRLPDDTETSVKDGWLYTGDIGYLDKDGFLVITDRKKDIIVTSLGKNIAPQKIETLIKADRYINDVMVYGDKKKYLTALILPDFEGLVKYARFKKIPFRNMKELAADEKIRDFIRRRIDKTQRELPSYEQIKKFIILYEELSQDEGELTPTLKIRRKVVTAKYKKELDALYEEDIR